jgi:hypothetical protein
MFVTAHTTLADAAMLLDMHVDEVRQQWLLARREYTAALAEYEAAYRALAARPRDAAIDTSASAEFMAEHRAREKLLAVHRRMKALNPARAKRLPFYGTTIRTAR